MGDIELRQLAAVIGWAMFALISFCLIFLGIIYSVIRIYIKMETKRLGKKWKKIQLKWENRPQLTVENDGEEVTISMEDGTEVVHWIKDEWEEDPSLINVICDAVVMSHVHPEQLLKIHAKHIESQRAINFPDE